MKETQNKRRYIIEIENVDSEMYPSSALVEYIADRVLRYLPYNASIRVRVIESELTKHDAAQPEKERPATPKFDGTVATARWVHSVIVQRDSYGT